MKVKTRYFGEVEIGDEKIIHFEQGIPGFEEYKDYTVLYDIEKGKESFFLWLQCVTEEKLAFPVVNPFKVKEDYNPTVEDEVLKEGIGDCSPDDLAVFLMARVPSDPRLTTINLKAPIIINTVERRGMQLIVENEDYKIRHRLMADEEE